MFPRVSAIDRIESVFQIVFILEFSYKEGILPAGPTFSLPLEQTHIRPPILRLSTAPDPAASSSPIDSLSRIEFFRPRLVLQVPGFLKKTLASHPGELLD